MPKNKQRSDTTTIDDLTHGIQELKLDQWGRKEQAHGTKKPFFLGRCSIPNVNAIERALAHSKCRVRTLSGMEDACFSVKENGDIYYEYKKQKNDPSTKILYEARSLFRSVNEKGFADWLAGKKGWELDPDVKSWAPHLDALNKLQEVFCSLATDRLKKHRSSQKLLWPKCTHIKESVNHIRDLLEKLRYFNELEPEERYGLLGITVTNTTDKEWKRVMSNIKTLMRSSQWGVDAPVNWASHTDENIYPYTLVTERMMGDLFHALVIIFQMILAPSDKRRLGTVWYERGKFSAAWNTTKNALPEFATKEQFRDRLNR